MKTVQGQFAIFKPSFMYEPLHFIFFQVIVEHFSDLFVFYTIAVLIKFIYH